MRGHRFRSVERNDFDASWVRVRGTPFSSSSQPSGGPSEAGNVSTEFSNRFPKKWRLKKNHPSPWAASDADVRRGKEEENAPVSHDGVYWEPVMVLSGPPDLHGDLQMLARGSSYLLSGGTKILNLKKTKQKNRQHTWTRWVIYIYLIILISKDGFFACFQESPENKWPYLIIYSQCDAECSVSQEITAGCFAL